MKEVNLLPEELKPKTYAVKISKKLRKYALFGLVLFFISAMVAGGSLIALTIRSNYLTENGDSLKSQVSALKATEQKLILVQDRLGKIDNILSSDTSASVVDALALLVNNLPQEVVLESTELKPGLLNISVSTDSSKNLSNFFRILSSLGYKSVTLSSFSYIEGLGYDIFIKIVN